MPKKYEGFSFERHQFVGQALYKMRNHLQALLIEIGEAYGKSSRAMKRIQQTCEAIERLRCLLNILVAAENPHRKNREVKRCYYPDRR